MRPYSSLSRHGLLAFAAVVAPLCACQPSAEPAGPRASLVASRNGVASAEALASPGWHATVIAVVAQAHVNPLAASRAHALLGVAQYRAVQRAERGNGNGDGEAAAFDDESGRGGQSVARLGCRI